MGLGFRTALGSAVLCAATVTGVVIAAPGAFADCPPGGGHTTFRHDKQAALRQIEHDVAYLHKFDVAVADDGYLPNALQHHTVTVTTNLIGKEKSVEQALHAATSRKVLDKALARMHDLCGHGGSAGGGGWSGTASRRGGHEPSLAKQKAGAQLMLDARTAQVEQWHAESAKGAHPDHHQNVAKDLRQIANTKTEVAHARNEKQLERALRGPCGGHGGGRGGHATRR